MTARSHWDAIYESRHDDALSWHEDRPAVSIRVILESCPEPP